MEKCPAIPMQPVGISMAPLTDMNRVAASQHPTPSIPAVPPPCSHSRPPTATEACILNPAGTRSRHRRLVLAATICSLQPKDHYHIAACPIGYSTR
ncbi:hypothetical protein BDW68DRAFT_166326 [Aspergillus falconensis]